MKNTWFALFLLLPFTMVFKGVNRYEDFQVVNLVLKQTQKVKPFVMTKAEKGFFEYEGNYEGEEQELLDTLTQALSGKLNVEPKRENEKLVITISPVNP